MSEYTGKRIVPRHDGEWDSTKDYEQLTIVLSSDDGVSYIARKEVPAGTALSDTEYWAVCSQFSRQLDSYQKQVDADFAAAEAKMQDNREAMDDAVKMLTARLDANVTASTDGDADYAAEVVDARVDADGLAFDSLGDAVRTANSALDMAVPVMGVSSYRSNWNSESGGVKASILSVNGSGRGMEVVFSVGLDEDSLYGYSYGQMKISSTNYTSYLEGKIVDILILSDSEEEFPLVLAYGWSAFNYSNVENGLILYKSVMIRKGSNVIRLNMGSDKCVQAAEANAALDSPSSTFYIFAEIGTLGLAGFAKDYAGLDAVIRVYCCVNREENMDGTGLYSKFSSVDDVWEIQQRDLKEKYHHRYNFADESYVSAFIINEELESSGYGRVTVEGNRVSVNKECRTSDGYNAYVCINASDVLDAVLDDDVEEVYVGFLKDGGTVMTQNSEGNTSQVSSSLASVFDAKVYIHKFTNNPLSGNNKQIYRHVTSTEGPIYTPDLNSLWVRVSREYLIPGTILMINIFLNATYIFEDYGIRVIVTPYDLGNLTYSDITSLGLDKENAIDLHRIAKEPALLEHLLESQRDMGRTTYYVSKNGSEDNTGLFPWSPIPDFSGLSGKSNIEIFIMDDGVYGISKTFKMGENSRLYSYGNRPTIDCYQTTGELALLDGYENVYYTEYAGKVGQVVMGGVLSWKLVTSLEKLTNEGEFYPDTDNGILYVYSEEGRTGLTVKVAPNFNAISVSNDYVEIENIRIIGAGCHGISQSSSHDIKISKCEVSFIGGILQNASARYGNGIQTWGVADCYNILVCDNIVTDCYDAGITHQVNDTAVVADNYNVHYLRNRIENCFYLIEFFHSNSSAFTDVLFKDNVGITSRSTGYRIGATTTESAICCWRSNGVEDEIVFENNVFYDVTRAVHASKSLGRVYFNDNLFLLREDAEDTALSKYVVNEENTEIISCLNSPETDSEKLDALFSSWKFHQRAFRLLTMRDETYETGFTEME